jgi:hypothetical protein
MSFGGRREIGGDTSNFRSEKSVASNDVGLLAGFKVDSELIIRVLINQGCLLDRAGKLVEKLL